MIFKVLSVPNRSMIIQLYTSHWSTKPTKSGMFADLQIAQPSVIWVSWMSFVRDRGIFWESEMLIRTLLLWILCFQMEREVFSFFSFVLFLFVLFCFLLELIVAVELTRVDCLPSQIKHAFGQLCYLLAALSVQSKMFNLFFFLQHLLFITVTQSVGLVVNIQLDCIQK